MTGVTIIFIMCVYLMIKGTFGSFAGGHDRRSREHQVSNQLLKKGCPTQNKLLGLFTLKESLPLNSTGGQAEAANRNAERVKRQSLSS